MFFLILLLLWLRQRSSRKLMKDYGLKGERVYSDLTRETGKVRNRVFYSKSSGISGKPDNVVFQDDGTAVVWEFKSGRAPVHPYMNHKVQLACYAILIQDETGRRVDKGVIRYGDGTVFEVPISHDLRRRALGNKELIEDIQRGVRPKRNHTNPNRCRSCRYRSVCPERLM